MSSKPGDDELLREEHEAREQLIDAEVEAQETLDEAEELGRRRDVDDESA